MTPEALASPRTDEASACVYSRADHVVSMKATRGVSGGRSLGGGTLTTCGGLAGCSDESPLTMEGSQARSHVPSLYLLRCEAFI
jgi:hypothetical protein